MYPIPELIFSSYIVLFASSLILFLLDGRKADVFMITVLTLSALLNITATIVYVFTGMPTIHIVLSKAGILGEVYGLLIDPMSISIGLVVTTAGYPFMVYSIEYMTPRNREHPIYRGKGRFHAWMTLFLASTQAFIYSSTIIQLLIFFELMSLSCWGVVSYYLTPEAHRAGIKALITTHAGSLLGLFLAISYCLLEGVPISLHGIGMLDPTSKAIVFGGVLIASLAKSAQFPFYSWLPDAMVAPTPASAFLHGAAMIEMGVYLLARIIQFMHPLPLTTSVVLATAISLTLFMVSYLFIPQRDSKRLLAYSTIAESGIMYAGLIAACMGYTVGLQASMFLLFTHAYVKGLAFLTSGLFSYYIGTVDMEKIRNLIRMSRFISFSWSFSLLGLAGVPPMPVFFGKLWVILSLVRVAMVEPYIWIPIVAIIVCSIVFFIISLHWIHNMVLKSGMKEQVYEVKLSSIFKLSIIVLIVLAVISPFISYPLISNITLMGSD